MDGKVVISTPVDTVTAKMLDKFCGEIHRNRAEVMRGLLYALLIDGKQFIFDEWQEQWREQMKAVSETIQV